jgi:Tail tubular protein
MALPSTSYQGRTTELEAINMHLLALGLSNVQSLNSVASNVDAFGAQVSLLQTSRQVQSKGWHFNTLEDFKLSPTPSGEILLPNNVLRVESTYVSNGMDLVERDGKLWSNDTNSFLIASEVYVRYVALLRWEQMPEFARWYIAVKSVRQYTTNRSSSQTKNQFTSQDEREALIDMQTADSLIRKGSLSRRNVHVQRMRANRGRRY